MQPKCIAESVTNVGMINSGEDPTKGEMAMPSAIPAVDANVVCDPALAVMSAMLVPVLALEKDK